MPKEIWTQDETDKSTQKIYVFSDRRYPGWLKVGMTCRAPEIRVREQYASVIPYGNMPYKILLVEDAIRNDQKPFSDHDVHDMLSAKRHFRGYGEWFHCSIDDIKNAIADIKNGTTPNEIIEHRKSTQHNQLKK